MMAAMPTHGINPFGGLIAKKKSWHVASGTRVIQSVNKL